MRRSLPQAPTRAVAPAVALLTLLALLAAPACSGAGERLLLVRVGPELTSTTVFAVPPGGEVGDRSEVAEGSIGPGTVARWAADGFLRSNTMGLAWKGGVLLSDQTRETSRVTAGTPGGERTTLATADPEQGIQTVVLARGAFMVDGDECRLSRSVEEADTVGTGRCTVSTDERWVVSWPADGGDLEVRDLRDDSTEVVRGNFVGAVALAHDARVLGLENVDGGTAAKVVDATDGEVVASLDPVSGMQPATPAPQSTAFVVTAVTQEGTELWQVDADGEVTTIARGAGRQVLLAATTVDGVWYLAADESGTSELWHWEQGEEPERALTGRLTATPVADGGIVVTEQTAGRLRIWHSEGGHLADEPDISTPLQADDAVSVVQAKVQGDTVHLLLGSADSGTYARVDLAGEDDAVPVAQWSQLVIGSIDGHGTAALVGAEGPEDRTSLLVVEAGSDTAERRAGATEAADITSAVVHEGTVWYTLYDSDGSTASVWEVGAVERGNDEPERAYEGMVVIGATWDEYGGAGDSQALDPARIFSEASPTSSQG